MRSETFSCFTLIKLYFHTLKLERFDPCGSLIEFMWRLVRWPPGCGCFPGASACSSASSRGEVMAVSPGTQRLKWFLQHVVAFRRIVKLTQQHISHDVVVCQSAVGNTTQEVISTTCLTQDQTLELLLMPIRFARLRCPSSRCVPAGFVFKWTQKQSCDVLTLSLVLNFTHVAQNKP